MQCLQRAVEPDLKLMRAKREAEDGPYVPFYRSEAYPTNFCHVNFRQLPLKTLMLYAVLFGINVRPDCTRDECATAGAASSVFPPGMDTYSNRIAYALHKLPDQRGSFTEICDIIEQDFSDSLNWKLESDVRRTPVWKSSVRKILISNQRFKTIGPESKHDFTFSSPAAARMC
eukprot:TRINITY_DN7417_c0_g1_i4.p1 TRINITY_DN7417_c0_g1~~TRINITY_DN7417_c0_g1_i4.p1  ORF type:complete len:173 (-),score=34.95 TRINITY_DN7417_c0_g1_i4:529-1047(-)